MSEIKITDDLRPAEECIWYVMATVAGVPKSSDDKDTINKNRYYWNGYMRSLLSCDELERMDGNANLFTINSLKEVSKLTENDKVEIQNALDARGFKNKNQPNGQVSFQYLEFSEVLYFSDFIFTLPVFFTNSVFGESVFLNNAVFFEDGNFYNTEFQSYFHAEYVNFRKNVIFDDSKFLDHSIFKNTQFTGRADFKNTKFSKHISFYNSHFYGCAVFKHTWFVGPASFSTVKFEDKVNFSFSSFDTSMLFLNILFKKHPPNFLNCKFPDNINWEKSTWPTQLNGLDDFELNLHVQAYERLSLMMSNLEKHHDKHRFYRLEMQARRALDPNFFVRAANLFYEKISDYGYGFDRVLKWWTLNIFGGAALIYPWTSTPFGDSILGNFWLVFKLACKSVVVSLSNAHAFLGLQRGPLKDAYSEFAITGGGWFNFVWGTQAILGVMLLFFVGLTLRNRFRMV